MQILKRATKDGGAESSLYADLSQETLCMSEKSPPPYKVITTPIDMEDQDILRLRHAKIHGGSRLSVDGDVDANLGGGAGQNDAVARLNV